MTRFSAIALCTALILSACGSSAPKIGADGRPLPTVYKITRWDEGKIPVRFLDSLNTLRMGQGLGPMQLNPQLSAAAVAHSYDMSAQARPWHFGSDGSSPLLRAQRAGYGGYFEGELIAETYEDELNTLTTWSSQSDTRDILMNAQANEIGFGWYQESSGKIWWTLTTGDNKRPAQAPVSATALGRTVSSEMDGVSQ